MTEIDNNIGFKKRSKEKKMVKGYKVLVRVELTVCMITIVNNNTGFDLQHYKIIIVIMDYIIENC